MTRSRISRTDAADGRRRRLRVRLPARAERSHADLDDRGARAAIRRAMQAPLNEFVHARGSPDAGAAARRAPAATLRSSAWVDLADGPVVLDGAGDARPVLRDVDGGPVDEHVRLGRGAHDRDPQRRLRDQRPALAGGRPPGRHGADRRPDGRHQDLPGSRRATRSTASRPPTPSRTATVCYRPGERPGAVPGRRAPRPRRAAGRPSEQVERMDARDVLHRARRGSCATTRRGWRTARWSTGCARLGLLLEARRRLGAARATSGRRSSRARGAGSSGSWRRPRRRPGSRSATGASGSGSGRSGRTTSRAPARRARASSPARPPTSCRRSCARTPTAGR